MRVIAAIVAVAMPMVVAAIRYALVGGASPLDGGVGEGEGAGDGKGGGDGGGDGDGKGGGDGVEGVVGGLLLALATIV